MIVPHCLCFLTLVSKALFLPFELDLFPLLLELGDGVLVKNLMGMGGLTVPGESYKKGKELVYYYGNNYCQKIQSYNTCNMLTYTCTRL